MLLKIDEIKIGTRRREDYGNIQELADSIKKYGLLHPVVLDVDNNLVAGGRRLEACKLLGWAEIPCTYLEKLSVNELRVIELEENIKRKDLTETELSRNLVELAEIKAEELKERFRAESAQNSNGRPAKPDSIRQVAKEMGIPPKTLHDAKQHAAAVDKYPGLEELPKYQAIDTAKKLDTLPEEELTPFQRAVEERRQQYKDEIRNRTPEEKLQVRADNYRKVTDRMVDFFHSLSMHPVDEYFYGLSKVEHLFNGIQLFTKNHLDMVDAGVLWLQEYRRKYAEVYLKEKTGLKVVRKDEKS